MKTVRYVCLFAVLLIDGMAVEKENLQLALFSQVEIEALTYKLCASIATALGNFISEEEYLHTVYHPDRSCR